MANRRRQRTKPPVPAADNMTYSRPADLFRGHDPAEVEQRLIEVFSGMPCDLGTDDMAPPSEEDLELIRSCEGAATSSAAASAPNAGAPTGESSTNIQERS